MTIRPIAAAALLAGLALGTALPALAQTGQAPNARPGTSEPSKDATGSTNTLSEKLGETGGVIRPPAGVDPEITTKAPVPNPGTTTVITPGSTPQQPGR